MNIKQLAKLKIPDKPGVYFFKRRQETVYIGKATSLRSRVKSYFNRDLIAMRGPVIVEMVFRTDKIDWQETDSVLEALILEASLIKKHQPKYNTKEKSDKSFNYVVITKEKLPRLIIVRGKELEGQKNISSAVFGPFTNGAQLKEALGILRRIFPYLDEKFKNNYRFYKQVDLVPDIGSSEAIQKYKKNIGYLKLFFQGKKKDIIRSLKKDMLAHAKLREFERANEIKKQLFALQHINDVALLKKENNFKGNENIFRIEAYDVAHMGGKNMVGVMTVVENDKVNKNEYRKFKIRTRESADDTGALTEILKRRLAHSEWRYPNIIAVDGGVAQINAAERVLKELAIEIPVVSVVKDARHKPRAINGRGELALNHKESILLGNNEAHRFAISYHKNLRGKNFLK